MYVNISLQVVLRTCKTRYKIKNRTGKVALITFKKVKFSFTYIFIILLSLNNTEYSFP